MINTHVNPETFADALIRWQEHAGRHDLPWQSNMTSYRVWVSEIMLQQTQVSAVIPYYQRFMRTFPTIESLATASIDAVLAHWSGLGYYARARNLHKTAVILCEQFDGKFPRTIDALVELPGIGQSTAGAILSFEFKQPTTICDGNVKRVLSRVFAIDTPKQQTSTTQALWAIATTLTPTTDTAIYNQAIMDLGSSICTRTKPDCQACPVQAHCLASQSGEPTRYPVSAKRKTKPTQVACLLIIESKDGRLLLEKRPDSGIWAGLWSFLQTPYDPDLINWLEAFFKDDLEIISSYPSLNHEFSHYRLEAHPLHIKLNLTIGTARQPQDNLLWCAREETVPGGVPSIFVKIRNYLNTGRYNHAGKSHETN